MEPEEITDWQPGEPVPPRYHQEKRARTGLIIGGAVPFGILYTLSTLAAAAAHDSGGGSNADALYVPCFGPFIQMAVDQGGTGNSILAIDGLGQCAGLAMLIVGFAVPRTILVHDRPRVAQQRLLPYVSTHAVGVGWVGTF